MNSVVGLNVYSKTITQPKKQGASQAQLYATGLSEEDMEKPQVLFSRCVLQFHVIFWFELLAGFQAKA
jgi:dihydroxyacid dehydratase/phosphogluconate dehydratase